MSACATACAASAARGGLDPDDVLADVQVAFRRSERRRRVASQAVVAVVVLALFVGVASLVSLRADPRLVERGIGSLPVHSDRAGRRCTRLDTYDRGPSAPRPDEPDRRRAGPRHPLGRARLGSHRVRSQRRLPCVAQPVERHPLADHRRAHRTRVDRADRELGPCLLRCPALRNPQPDSTADGRTRPPRRPAAQRAPADRRRAHVDRPEDVP